MSVGSRCPRLDTGASHPLIASLTESAAALQLWLNRRLGGECALVELLDNQCDGSGSWPIHGLLQTVARKAHLDFFSHIVGPRVGEALFEPTRGIQDAASQGLA